LTTGSTIREYIKMRIVLVMISVISFLLVYCGCTPVTKSAKPDGFMSAAEKKVMIKDIAVPLRPRDVVCADFNGDGLNDLATTSKPAKALVLINKNGYEFEQFTFDTLIHNTSIASADIDNDGDIDFVALTEYRFGPIFLNDGKGNFQAYDPHISTPKMSYYLSSADMNGDGWQDFVVVSEAGTQIMVIYNRGALRFDAKEFTAPVKDEHPDETANDMPELEKQLKEASEGLPEEITESEEILQARKEKITKKMLPQKYGSNKIRHFALTDINGDKRTDIVFPISGPVRKLATAVNSGNEEFSFRLFDVPGAEGPLTSIALIKQKGMDQPYIAVSQSSPGRIFLFRNDGNGNLNLFDSIETGVNVPLRMSSYDIDEDGNDELLVTYGAPIPLDSRSPVQVWSMGNDGKLRLRETFKSNGYAAYIGFCKFSEKEKAIVLSNIHENTLTLISPE
jgi:hypothetical protein